MILRVLTRQGVQGYGEALARPYVTGESVESATRCFEEHVAPALLNASWGDIRSGGDLIGLLEDFHASLPEGGEDTAARFHAARCLGEIALADAALREGRLGFSDALPARKQRIIYSAVVPATSADEARTLARRCRLLGLRDVKVKVNGSEDVERIAILRETLGPSASIRVDGNGRFRLEEALELAEKMERYQVEAFEQPLPRGNLAAWRELRVRAPLPLMADESLVTLRDAEELVREEAVDLWNLRLAKLGGILPTLLFARRAEELGVGYQLGCLVGETSILSAAGRHVAAHLGEARWVEGSYGALLLDTDVASPEVRFGWGGRAPALSGPGLGISVESEKLERFSTRICEWRN